MQIQSILRDFSNKYICVRNCVKDSYNLIQSADVIKVYDTLEMAKDSASEIRKFMKKYHDFDILYGDYEDYVNTRKNKEINHTVSDNSRKCSQSEIDEMIRRINGGSNL